MGRMKHIEIAGRDGEALGKFYGDLFGWEITKKDVGGFDYYEIASEGGLSAGIRHEPEGKAEIVVYYEVPDVDATVTEAQRLGAKVRVPPMQFGDLKFAVIEDPEGNPVGLTQE